MYSVKIGIILFWCEKFTWGREVSSGIERMCKHFERFGSYRGKSLGILGKKSISPPNLWGLEYITPQPMKQFISPLNFSKPVKLPSKTVSKNHSKSQKNHKMKNSIVLDSKWVDLHNEHIIWYALVYFFAVALDLCFLHSCKKNILKYTILYVHSVDILIWSPTQLNFLFYNFSVIYYGFSKPL